MKRKFFTFQNSSLSTKKKKNSTKFIFIFESSFTKKRVNHLLNKKRFLPHPLSYQIAQQFWYILYLSSLEMFPFLGREVSEPLFIRLLVPSSRIIHHSRVWETQYVPQRGGGKFLGYVIMLSWTHTRREAFLRLILTRLSNTCLLFAGQLQIYPRFLQSD